MVIGHLSHLSHDLWDDQKLRSHTKSIFGEMPNDQNDLPSKSRKSFSNCQKARDFLKLLNQEYLVISGHLGHSRQSVILVIKVIKGRSKRKKRFFWEIFPNMGGWGG